MAVNSDLPNEYLISRSDAVVFVLKQHPGLWRFAALFMQLVPRFLRDAVYKVVARNRYRIFGRSEVCPPPNSGLRPFPRPLKHRWTKRWTKHYGVEILGGAVLQRCDNRLILNSGLIAPRFGLTQWPAGRRRAAVRFRFFLSNAAAHHAPRSRSRRASGSTRSSRTSTHSYFK